MLKKLNGLLPFILLASYNPLSLFFIITEDKSPEKELQQELQFQLSFRKPLLCLLKRYARKVYKLIHYVSKPKPLRTVT